MVDSYSRGGLDMVDVIRHCNGLVWVKITGELQSSIQRFQDINLTGLNKEFRIQVLRSIPHPVFSINCVTTVSHLSCHVNGHLLSKYTRPRMPSTFCQMWPKRFVS